MKQIVLLTLISIVSLSSCSDNKNASQNISEQTFEEKKANFQQELYKTILEEYKRFPFQKKPEQGKHVEIGGLFCGWKSGDTLAIQWTDRFDQEYEIVVSKNSLSFKNSKIDGTPDSDQEKFKLLLATATQILPNMKGGYAHTIEMTRPFMNKEVVDIFETEEKKAIPFIGLAIAQGNTHNNYILRNSYYEIEQGGKKYQVSLFGSENPGQWEVREGTPLSVRGPFATDSGNEFIGGLHFTDFSKKNGIISYYARLFDDIPFFKEISDTKIINGEEINGWKTIPITKQEFLEHYKGL